MQHMFQSAINLKQWNLGLYSLRGRTDILYFIALTEEYVEVAIAIANLYSYSSTLYSELLLLRTTLISISSACTAYYSSRFAQMQLLSLRLCPGHLHYESIEDALGNLCITDEAALQS